MKISTFRGQKGQKIILGDEERERNRFMLECLIRKSKKRSELNLGKAASLQSREAVRKAIRDLEKYQPAGLMHLVTISKVIGRQIRVHQLQDNIDLTIGRRSKEKPIDLEFNNGHWTLKNNQDPDIVQVAVNDCLFEVIAAQVGGLTPGKIRHETIKKMKFDESRIAKELESIMFLEKWKDALEMMLGGARYYGRSASDAKRVIDNSQNVTCHAGGRGHPRGHASYPNASGPTDSVENYSRNGWKTGFLSREDQDFVGHLTFITDEAQEAMDRLNSGTTNEPVDISCRDLRSDDLPLGCDFKNGEKCGVPQRIKKVTAVFRHHSGKYGNRDAEVFVHTFYPRLR